MDAELIIAGATALGTASLNRIINAINNKEEHRTLYVLGIIMQLLGFLGIMWGVQ